MPAQYFRAAFRSTNAASGALIVNVFHYELDSLTSGVSFTDVANDVSAHLNTQYFALLSTLDKLHDLTCTVETYPGAVPAQGIVPYEVNGGRTTASTTLSPALCALLQLRTQTPKRYARGHNFLPPAYDGGAGASGGGWNNANNYWTSAQNFRDQLSKQFTVGNSTYTPIIFSRTRARTNTTPYVFPVVSVTVDPKQHFLRSRLTSP